MKLPSTWRTARIADFGKVVTGNTPPTNDDTNFGGPIPFVTPGDLGKSSFISKAERTLSIHGSRKARLVPKNSTMVVCIGTVGKTGIAGAEVATNQQINSIIPSDGVDGFFVYYAVSFMGESIRRLAGTQTLPLVSKGEFEDFPVALPPLPEQRKIADILGAWDETLEKLDALIAAKARRKQALIQQLLTGQLQLRSFKSRPWKSLRMSDLLERVFRPAEIDETVSLPLVSIRRRLGGLFRRPDVMASEYKTQDLHFLKAGDFVISKRQVAHGAWSIVEPEFDGTLVSKEYAILVNRAPDKLDMRFFAWLAQTPRMVRLSRVASTGVHIEKLIFDPDVFLREKIRVPGDIAEQRAIAAVLDTADAELRLLRQQRTALDHQKRGLMQQLLTGQKRVRV